MNFSKSKYRGRINYYSFNNVSFRFLETRKSYKNLVLINNAFVVSITVSHFM